MKFNETSNFVAEGYGWIGSCGMLGHMFVWYSYMVFPTVFRIDFTLGGVDVFMDYRCIPYLRWMFDVRWCLHGIALNLILPHGGVVDMFSGIHSIPACANGFHLFV